MQISERSGTPVRLAILDDHELLLDSMTSWISANAPDFELVLTASTWFGLVQSDRFPTDLVLLEIDPACADVIVRRWQETTGEAAVLAGEDRVFADVAAARGADHDVINVA